MQFESRSDNIMERPSDSIMEPGISLQNFDMMNMTWEEVQAHWALVDNFTSGQTPQDLDIMKEKSCLIGIIALYCVVCFTGFVENLITLIVLLKNKHLQTPANVFITGLAVSDILLCSFNLPFQLYYQLTETWPFGGTLCQVIMSTYGVPIFVSSMSILMIAIDRYILIVHPYRKKMTNLTAVIMVVSITLFTIILSVPIIVYTNYQIVDLPALRIYKELCIEKWPDIRLRHAYSVTMVAMQFFIPLTATSVLYWRISVSLQQRLIKRRERRRDLKTNKILISIVILFSICWMPWNIVNLMVEFNQKLFSGRYFKLIDLLLKIFAMSSACINPFLYGWLNDNLRKELKVFCVRKPRNRTDQIGNRLLRNRLQWP